MVTVPVDNKKRANIKVKQFKKAGLVNVRIRKPSKEDKKLGFKFVVKGRKRK